MLLVFKLCCFRPTLCEREEVKYYFMSLLSWHAKSSTKTGNRSYRHFLNSTKSTSHRSENVRSSTKFSWKVLNAFLGTTPLLFSLLTLHCYLLLLERYFKIRCPVTKSSQSNLINAHRVLDELAYLVSCTEMDWRKLSRGPTDVVAQRRVHLAGGAGITMGWA